MLSQRGPDTQRRKTVSYYQFQRHYRGVLTHYHSVIPGKERKLIKAGDEIPARGDVTRDEDAEGEDREGVHRSRALHR
jgi:hypothetical protein